MKMRENYTCPLEMTHDIIKGKWKPIILWQLNKGGCSLSSLKKSIAGISQKMLIQHLNELLEYGIIGKLKNDGYPNTKAMLPPRKREGIRVFYFTTNTSSMRVGHYRENPKACIYFCDRRFFRGVMLTGVMEVLEDSVHKEMIWRKGDTMYYPLGVTDPDYCVLRFTARQGRFYSNFSSENFELG